MKTKAEEVAEFRESKVIEQYITSVPVAIQVSAEEIAEFADTCNKRELIILLLDKIGLTGQARRTQFERYKTNTSKFDIASYYLNLLASGGK